MPGKWKPALLLALLMSVRADAATNDATLEYSSGEQQVALLELFTSEGCSSCPPADRWLSKLKSDPGLWKDFTPIAFHVDYWDYIGWNDKFAKPEFGDRQRRYAAEGGARFVYTPGLFLRGNEWVGWRTRDPLTNDDNKVGELSMRISGEDVNVQFEALDDNYTNLQLHVAILGMNIETRVKAGENNGRTLHHDFVALSVVSVPFTKLSVAYEATMQLPEVGPESVEQAIVAWVSEGRRQTPIQSVGGLFSQH